MKHSTPGWGFSTKNLIVRARQKLPRNRVDEIAALAGLTKKEMARVLGITERNLYNQHQSELSVVLSEKLLLLESVLMHGLAVFDGDQAVFRDWLRTPLPALAVPELGFSPPVNQKPKLPLSAMGTKTYVPDLSAVSKIQSEMPVREQAGQERIYPTPLSVLDTITGCKLVDNIFVRIEAGVFS